MAADNAAIHDSLHAPSSRPPRAWWARRLASENPFYLLSAALVIHSTGISLRSSSPDLPLGVLVGLVLGYLVLLAGVGVFIVRKWNVWDDARSIPLLLVLLLLELSLCFDSQLQEHYSRGVLGLLGCGAAAIVVSEAVIRGLRLKIPPIYRLPFYLQLLLAMLPGAAYAGLSGVRSESFVRWSLFGYAIVCGLSVLALIPAARSAADSVRTPKCPWIWPIHPWSLFVIVWLCLGFRLILLTMSFDPALELDRIAANQNLAGIFAPYWLIPMVLGIGWLLVEAGLFHKHRLLRTIGLCAAPAGVVLALWPAPDNAASQQFLAEWIAWTGSPAWCAAVASIAFHILAAVRGVPGATKFLTYSPLYLTVITPESISWDAAPELREWPLFAVAAIRLAGGLWDRSPLRTFEGAGWLVLAYWLPGHFKGGIIPADRAAADALILSALLVLVTMRQTCPEWLGNVTKLAIAGKLWWNVVQSLGSAGPQLTGVAELAILAPLLYGMSRILGDPVWKGLALATAASGYLVGISDGWKALRQWTRWPGLNHFVLGVLLLHVGIAWSAWKSRRLTRSTPSQPPPAAGA